MTSIPAEAINAVMAGRLPEYFSEVLAAHEACNADRFNHYGSTASTGGSATSEQLRERAADAVRQLLPLLLATPVAAAS